MDRKFAYVIIAVIIILAAAFAAYILSSKCNYDDPAKDYLKGGRPCVINFLCVESKEAFSDECGCGCKLKTPSTS